MSKTQESPLLSIRNASKQYGPGCSYCQDPQAVLEENYCPRCGTVYAVRHASLDLYEGEIVGIVGESGSGKSTLMQLLYFDQEASSGDFRLQTYQEGKVNLFQASKPDQEVIRNQLLGMVYQNPLLGLRMQVSSLSNVAEKMITANYRHVGQMTAIAEDLLTKVSIPLARAKESPANFSGGMQQRVQIAKALSNHPPVLFLDEVTTGLDLSVQAAVLDLIKVLRRDFSLSILVVSHDLGVIRMLADRTIVMYQGHMIEAGLTDQILEDPQHVFTQELVYALL